MFEEIFIPVNSYPGVDLICVLPGVQQVVGGVGTIWNLIMLTGNVGNRALKELEHFFKNVTMESIEELKSFREQSNKEMEEHTTYLVVNILRCIPIVGSGISFWRGVYGALLGASRVGCCR